MSTKYITLCVGLSLLISGASGCTSYQREKLTNLTEAPKMDKVNNPVLARQINPLVWPEEENDDESGRHYANSLWQPGASTFFKDQRARKVGDILKIIVKINDKAELDSSTNRRRTNNETATVTNVAGLEKRIVGIFPEKADPLNLLNLESSNDNNGNGTIDREEKITTQVAAMVTQILPNGNLVVSGSQEIRVNHELRQVTIEGIVQPGDIAADNSVESNLIAEARIAYGGKGLLSEVQQPRWGYQLIELLSPF